MTEIAELRRLANQQPSDGRVRLRLGAELFQVGRFEESAVALEEARTLETSLEGEANYLLAKIHLERGLPSLARALLRRALRTLPATCELRDLATSSLQTTGGMPPDPLSRVMLRSRFPLLVGNSQAFLKALHELDPMVADRQPILLQGESGTGRRLAADAVRRQSPEGFRSGFRVLDCSTRSPTACKQELFGLARDAHSGPRRAHPSLLERANRGVVLIEGVDLLDHATQRRLARFLISGSAARLKGSRARRPRTRLIMTVEEPPRVLRDRGRLVPELYERLRDRTVRIPPLRERREDVPLLVDRFWRSKTPLPASAVKALAAQSWPGNVAQLREVLGWLVTENAITPATVERFHERTSLVRIESALDRPEVVDPAASSSVPAELARVHRICPLRHEGPRLVVAIDGPRPRLELRGLQAILGTRVRWLQLAPAQLEELLERAYPTPRLPDPKVPSPTRSAARLELLDLLDGCLTRAEFPDPDLLTRLVTTRLCDSVAASAVVLYGVSAQGLRAEGLALSPELVNRRPELASLHGRACPALDLPPDAGLAGRTAKPGRRLTVAAASSLPGEDAEPHRLRALGIDVHELHASPVICGDQVKAVLVTVDSGGDGGVTVVDRSNHLREVTLRLSELLAPNALMPDMVARRIADRHELKLGPAGWQALDLELYRDVGPAAIQRLRALPLTRVGPDRLRVASDKPLSPEVRERFHLETGHWIAEQRIVPGVALRDCLERAEREALPAEETEMIGWSAAMVTLRTTIDLRVRDDEPVLIQGEPGTGKERIARVLHSQDTRLRGPLHTINCAAISPALLETELFGMIRGGLGLGRCEGSQRRPGLLESAAGGTVFLDEVHELPLDLQTKLVRALQEGTVRPLGSNATVPISARIVVATDRDLQAEVNSGRFRADLRRLLGRMDVLHAPTLRERPEDLPVLAEFFLAQASEHLGRRASLRPEDRHAIVERLSHYDWPGNVRELEHVVTRLARAAEGSEITLADLEAVGSEIAPRTRRVRAEEPKLRLRPGLLESLPLLTLASLPLPVVPAIPVGPILRAIPAGPILRAIPTGPVLAAIPVGRAPPPAAAPPLPHLPRRWFTREGWNALLAAVAVYLCVIGLAIAWWSRGAA